MSFVGFALGKVALNKEMLNEEIKVHAVALLVAILGPLINLLLGYPLSSIFGNPYIYWAAALFVYVAILLPFTYKSPLTLLRLIILGVMVEDFFSNVWRSLFFNNPFLPFFNWYTQHFPFLGSLGEPSPYIMIPRFYILAFAIYLGLTFLQYKRLNEIKRETNEEKA